jgi:hypothetical protein
MSAIPIGISQIIKAKSAQKQNQVKQVPGPQAGAKRAELTPQPSSDVDADDSADASTPGQKMSIGRALGMLAFAGLASPFLDLENPVHGVIGLVILLVGIRIAWQLTAQKPIDIVGPFNNSAPAAKLAPG